MNTKSFFASASRATVGSYWPQIMPLPGELIDTIIDSLQGQPPALKRCALVCKSWVPRSHYHLFHSVTLRPRNATEFVKILSSPICTFARYVNHVTFFMPSGWIDETVPFLTPLFAVHSLSFGDMDDVRSETVNTLFTTFRAVVSLELHNSFDTVEEHLDFVAGFRSLKKLIVFHSSNYMEEVSPGRHYQGHHWQLRTLVLSCSFLSDILRWVTFHQPNPQIHSLCMFDIRQICLPDVQHFLLALAPSLRRLRLIFPLSYTDSHAYLRYVDISCLRELRSISLHLRSRDWFGEPIPNDFKILSQITSAHMKEIIFYFWCDNDSFDWGELVNVLSQPQFSNLRRIHFRLRLFSGGTTKDQIRSLLHNWEVRRILYLTEEHQEKMDYDFFGSCECTRRSSCFAVLAKLRNNSR